MIISFNGRDFYGEKPPRKRKPKKQVVIKRIEPVPFDTDAPQGVIPVKYITEEQLRKLYPPKEPA